MNCRERLQKRLKQWSFWCDVSDFCFPIIFAALLVLKLHVNKIYKYFPLKE